MAEPAWTDYELELIKDTITDYREAGKQDQSALGALTKVLMHRNSKDVRNKFNEIRKELDYGDTTITHEVTDDMVVDLISQIDGTIARLEEIQQELHRLRQYEEDLTRLMDAIQKVR